MSDLVRIQNSSVWISSLLSTKPSTATLSPTQKVHTTHCAVTDILQVVLLVW